LLAEWHITPDYIVSNWTDELLELMVKKLTDRKQREMGAVEHIKPQSNNKVVSDETLFGQLGKKIKRK